MDAVVVKDVECEDCIYKAEIGEQKNLWCKRLGGYCEEKRHICMKSRWYVQMCSMTARIDKAIKDQANGNRPEPILFR